jgi:hypothetical protein
MTEKKVYKEGRLKSEASCEDMGMIYNSEQQIESTKLYKFGNPENPRIVVSMRDDGETNTLLPIVKKLKEGGDFCFSIFADGPGAKTMADHLNAKECSDHENILLEVANEVDGAALIIVSQSSDSGIGMALAATANVPVVAVEDFPGAVTVQDGGILVNNSPLLIPDWQCAMTEWSKNALLKLRPDFDPDKVVITGSPAFDNLDPVKKAEVKNTFRERHNIPDKDRVIVWVGQTGEADTESLKLFVKGLKSLSMDDYRLVIRRHPKDERSEESLNSLTRDVSNHLLETNSELTDEVRQAADLVVTMFSTEGLKSVCEQTLTLLIMVPEFLELSGYDKYSIPIAEDGSAAVVSEKDKMKQMLKNLLFDTEFQEQIREKMEKWKVDGKATERIVTLIKKIAESKQANV